MKLYHGMVVDRRVNGWDMTKIGTGNDQDGPGFYFTDNKDHARRHGKYVHTLEVDTSFYLKHGARIRKAPIRKLIRNAPDYVDTLTNWHENTDFALTLATTNICTAGEDFWDALTQVWADFYRGHEGEWIKQVRRATLVHGYLVPREKNGGDLHVVCINPDTVKILEVEND